MEKIWYICIHIEIATYSAICHNSKVRLHQIDFVFPAIGLQGLQTVRTVFNREKEREKKSNNVKMIGVDDHSP